MHLFLNLKCEKIMISFLYNYDFVSVLNNLNVLFTFSRYNRESIAKFIKRMRKPLSFFSILKKIYDSKKYFF
jgi:hypothetical protein